MKRVRIVNVIYLLLHQSGMESRESPIMGMWFWAGDSAVGNLVFGSWVDMQIQSLKWFSMPHY